MNPAWTIENFLEVRNNQLYINGALAIDLANEFDTPLFVFSEARIRHNIERLKRAESVIDCPLKICYAAKANSNMAILRAVKDAGSDLEVNSGGELFKALKIGFKPEQIIFNGTSKTETELEEAINAGIYAINADSFYEIELIETVAKKLKKRADVSLRLVPEIESDTLHGLQTALLTSKFGMMPDEALTAFRRWQPDDEFLNLCGIHLHIGSQNPKAASYAEALKLLFENLREIDKIGHKLSHLNLGGGFPVNYLRDKSHEQQFSDDQRELFSATLEPFDVLREAWQIVVKTAAAQNATHLLENIELLLEPGRSVIADAGICLTSVRNRKERPLQKSGVESGEWREKAEDSPLSTLHSPLSTDVWLLTDAGFNLLLSMETYKWYYHLISAGRAGEAHDAPYKLAGPLCDGGDVYFDIDGQNRLPDYRLLPENVQPNEVLALLNCGAYSIAQMFQYNGRQLPAIVLLKEDGAIELIRKRDSYEDLLINDVW
ncbi:MAG: diaminopimelate decarboxylase [Pyrinomonadaceae bacterium]|nr:diaminopimelate decarboxylase [Pyrinomonadaceae bacterium]